MLLLWSPPVDKFHLETCSVDLFLIQKSNAKTFCLFNCMIIKITVSAIILARQEADFLT